MLVVRIEIWPLGRESAKRTLGTAVIGNDGTGTPETGSYRVCAVEGKEHPHDLLIDHPEAYATSDRWRAEIKNYERRKGFWLLVAKALEKIHYA